MVLGMNGRWWVAAVFVVWAQGAGAHGFTDPTRPPWLGAGGHPSERAAGLQAIVLGAARRLALIDGRFVAVGARVGAARVMAIHHNSVVLRGPDGIRRLTLAPSRRVRKTAILKEGMS